MKLQKVTATELTKDGVRIGERCVLTFLQGAVMTLQPRIDSCQEVNRSIDPKFSACPKAAPPGHQIHPEAN